MFGGQYLPINFYNPTTRLLLCVILIILIICLVAKTEKGKEKMNEMKEKMGNMMT